MRKMQTRNETIKKAAAAAAAAVSVAASATGDNFVLYKKNNNC